MKYFLPIIILLFRSLVVTGQENNTTVDSAFNYRGLTKEECPPVFLSYINSDSLRTKAVLMVMNESLHPLGKYEFFDDGDRVSSLHKSMRMNRCTMLYIDSGQHQYHTMYQRLKDTVNFETGKIYFARLFSRPIWPVGGISVIKKNEKGEPVEYAAVLFEYINETTAIGIYDHMKKKDIIVNE